MSFEPEELFGTKLRALLQRHKNRDLFDLNEGLLQLRLDPDKLVACFGRYLAAEGHPITRAMAEERMLAANWADETALREWHDEAHRQTDEAVAISTREPLPDPNQEDWCPLATRHLCEG